MTSSSQAAASDRLARLQSFLTRDPENVRLLADAADAAYEIRQLDDAKRYLERLAGLASMSPETANLAALVAIGQARFEDAVALLEPIQEQADLATAPRFNLAWAYAMLGRHERAMALLDNDVIAAVPRAASLKIEMLHHLERYDEALVLGEELATVRPADERLMGSLAMLALDAENEPLARFYAGQATQDAQGLAALGTLAMADNDVEGAAHLFDAAIEREPRNPRAWMGKGLALLADQKAVDGLPAIDRGAALFDDHIGSWIAAGWAHFAAGDTRAARERFDRALALDPNFGETHGALAVLDITDGHLDEGRRRSEIALRLDRKAFGGQLAQLLLLRQAGDESGADRIRSRALSTPIGPEGRTIGQALSELARRRRR